MYRQTAAVPSHSALPEWSQHVSERLPSTNVLKAEDAAKSKIPHVNQSVRNHESNALIVAEQRRSAVREQEVVHQKAPFRTRPGPYKILDRS